MSRDRIAENILKKTLDDRVIYKETEPTQVDGSEYFHKGQVLDSGDQKSVHPETVKPSQISEDHLEEIASETVKNLDKQMLDYNQEAAVESALVLTIRDFMGGLYDGKIDAENYLQLKGLVKKMKKIGTIRTASYYTSKLDKIANEIREMVVSGEISPDLGYELEHALDEVSDEIEKDVTASVFEDHQLKILKDTVKNPNKSLLGGPDADEAKKILKKKFKFTDKQISDLENKK